MFTTTTQTGYVRMVPNSGSSAPGGAAIFGLQSNGVLITESGVPFTTPVLSGRIFAEINPLTNTGLALANPNNQDVTISFYSADSTGASSQTVSFTITAHQQITALLTNLPFALPSSFNGTLTFSASAPVSAIGLRSYVNTRSELILTTIPVLPVGSSASGNTLLVPNFNSTGTLVTEFVLVNPFDTPISGTIGFYSLGSKAGSVQPVKVSVNDVTGSTFNYSIAGRGVFAFVPQSVKNSSQVGLVRITPSSTSGSPSSFAVLAYQNGSGVTVSMTSVPAASAAMTLRSYAESYGVFGQAGSIRTGFMVSNPTGSKITVKMDMMNMDGTYSGYSASTSISAGGLASMLVTDLFPQLPASFRGIVRMVAPFPVVITAVRNRYNQRTDLLATDIPLYDESTAPLPETQFPLFVNGGGYSTQLVLLAANSAESGSMSLVVQNGSILPSGSVTPN
jgi:hypothetical protein